MLFFSKLLLSSVVGMFFFLSAAGMQGGDPNVDWYEAFFQEKKGQPVEEILKQANSRLHKAIKTKNPEEKAAALKELGLIHLTRSHDYEMAMDFLIKCLTIEDSLDLKESRIFTYLAMAKVFKEVGNYNKSGQLLEQALTFNEPLQNPNVQVLILNELGLVNASTGKMEEALKKFAQVLDFKNEIKNNKVEAEALFNIAHLFSAQGNYIRSLEHHKRALRIRRAIGDKRNESLSLNDVGELYRLMKNDTKALANHEVALTIRQSLDDKNGIAESYNNIGTLYYQEKKFEKAISNLQAGLQAALESQAIDQQLKSYDYLSLCYKELGAYDEALKNRELFVVASDFIQNQKYDQRLLESQNRYVIDTKESQIEALERERQQRQRQLQEQKNLRNFLVTLTGLTLMIGVLIFYLYKTKQRANKELQEVNQKVQQQNLQLQDLNATKDKFFSIIGHDLKGPLNSLTAFSRLLINHIDSLSKEEIQTLAKDFDKSLKNLFALLENLLEWSRSQTGKIEFKPEVFDLTTLLKENKELLQKQAQNKKIKLVALNDTKVFVNAHKPSINTVVRNLISNSIKFTPEGGSITVGLKPNHTQAIVSITDTGVGMSRDVIGKLFRIDAKHSTKGTADEKGTGLGLILCKDFVEKNGGKLWVESEEGKGSVFYFTVPQAS